MAVADTLVVELSEESPGARAWRRLLQRKSAVLGLVIIVLFVLFEPLGLYGRWLKIKLFFQLFPLYKRATFKRQKIYVKSERNR